MKTSSMSNKPLIRTKSQRTILKNLTVSILIICVSSLPYIHDLITIKGEGLAPWVPDFGLEKALTASDGKVMGFSSYRVFLYTLLIHLFAHIGWVGWMMDAKGKSYRFALLVPVVLSGYTVALLLFNARATKYNEPDTKFYLTLILSLIVIFNFFFNYKLKRNSQE